MMTVIIEIILETLAYIFVELFFNKIAKGLNFLIERITNLFKKVFAKKSILK